MPEAVSELDPKTQPEFASIATARSLDAAGGIRSDQLKRVVDLVEDEFVRSSDSLRRRPYGVDLALLFREGCGIRIRQAAKHCRILRAGHRVATQAGSRHFKGHGSRALPDETLYFDVGDDSSAADAG